MDLDSVADELYGLSLEEFTVTRNERAKQAPAQPVTGSWPTRSAR